MARFRRKRRRFKTRRRRRGRRRRKRGRGRISSVKVRSPLLMPDQFNCKLRWVFTSRQFGQGPDADFLFILNNVREPSLLFGGDAYGYPEISAFYNRVRVYGSSIKVTVTNLTINALKMVLVPDIQITPKDIAIQTEQPYAKTRYIGSMDSGAYSRTIKSYMSTRKLMGRTTIGPKFTQSTVGDPEQELYWHFTTTGMGIVNDFNYNIRVEMIYYCQFYARRALNSDTNEPSGVFRRAKMPEEKKEVTGLVLPGHLVPSTEISSEHS